MSIIPSPSAWQWAKSSYSGNGGSACVEWAPTYASVHGVVPVRDSKVVDGPILTLTPTAFAGLIEFARHADV
ncbi:DUF397 domain-containing protein [Streptomyces sp. NPDC020965]|uniref:DUF397 domain-containing protein n=1 Tax=Streptomyces sp. NPDC020965 TaxID=3365105 RepID=UPI0037985BB8